jgi:SAM-dependent methyltransferase
VTALPNHAEIFGECSLPTGPDPNIGEKFNYIYRTGRWGMRNGLGTSGSVGLPENNVAYARYVSEFIRANEIDEVVEVGCGDFGASAGIDFGKAVYLGIDVSSEVIGRVRELAAVPGKVEFACCDFYEYGIPYGDLLLCKNVLQHLCNDYVSKFVEYAQRFEHFIVTNDVSGKHAGTADIENGEFRHIGMDQFGLRYREKFDWMCGQVRNRTYVK